MLNLKSLSLLVQKLWWGFKFLMQQAGRQVSRQTWQAGQKQVAREFQYGAWKWKPEELFIPSISFQLRIEVHFFRFHWEIKCKDSTVNLVKHLSMIYMWHIAFYFMIKMKKANSYPHIYFLGDKITCPNSLHCHVYFINLLPQNLISFHVTPCMFHSVMDIFSNALSQKINGECKYFN